MFQFPLCRDRKSSMEAPPTDNEMAARLAKLKGVQQQVHKETSVHAGPPKSQEEQTMDLLSQVGGEVKLDATMPKPEDEIAERLARLRGQDTVAVGSSIRGQPRREDIDPEQFLRQGLMHGERKAKEGG